MASAELQLAGLLPGHPDEEWRHLAETLGSGSHPWAVLVGAGVSSGAGLPTWFGLAEEVVTHFGETYYKPDGANLPLLFDEYEVKDKKTFWTYVTSRVCSTGSATRTQELLCQLPFELFVTLNYDRLLEGPWSKETGNDTNDVMAYPHLAPARLTGRRLVYLHGRCPGGNGRLSSETCILTQGGYDNGYGESTPLRTAIEAIFMSYNVLVLGSSWTDPDLGQILHAIGRSSRLRRSKEEFERFAFVGTELPRYGQQLGLTFTGRNENVKPLFYHASGGNHRNLERALEGLVRLMPT